MTIAIINRYIQYFADSLSALNAKAPMPEIERLAMIVHSAMENKRRVYHTSKHVFHMCEGMNPRQVLAALFHDVVYFQLDGGFPHQTAAILDVVVELNNGALVLKSIDSEDTHLRLVADIFNFRPGQTLPLFGGMNEFLSAVVAVRLLQNHLQPGDLIFIVACIEATVPFRGVDGEGQDSMILLAQRVNEQSRKLLGGKSNEEIDQHVKAVLLGAIEIANRDVIGFAEPNPGKFLSVTWQLIEESNAPLAAVGVYTLQDYRRALSRMENFLRDLKPESVFHHYAHVPDDAEFDALNSAARKNLAFACIYLDAKLVSIAVIEALAIETGGNCPVSMFLGDIRSAYGKPDRIEDFLPPAESKTDLNQELVQVLEKGRAQESNNDLTASPLTAFIYRFMGDEGISFALSQSQRMFSNELPAIDFLKSLNNNMLAAIIDACAQIAISRRDELNRLKTILDSAPNS